MTKTVRTEHLPTSTRPDSTMLETGQSQWVMMEDCARRTYWDDGEKSTNLEQASELGQHDPRIFPVIYMRY
jgi:hypothetical protein